MYDFENTETYQSASNKVKEIIRTIVDIFGKDVSEVTNPDYGVYEVNYYNQSSTFKIFEKNDTSFSVLVTYDTDTYFSMDYTNISDFKADMYDKHSNGFVDENGFTVYFKVAYTNEGSEFWGTPIQPTSLVDDEDEESDNSEEVSASSKLASSTSIVPNDITKIRVVALRFDGRIIAFRFKTDKGAFDMRIEVATKYGLGEFKTEKFISLERVNGILMSSTEKKLRTCVPDVSLCEEDCKKLIDAVFYI